LISTNISFTLSPTSERPREPAKKKYIFDM
jgi:hypothetical protein